MIYYLRRFRRAVWEHAPWLILAILPAAFYLLVAAQRADSFSVIQDFDFEGDVPVAAADHPVRTLPLSELVSAPDSLFLDPFALSQLMERLRLETIWSHLTERDLPPIVYATMRLELVEPGRLSLAYQGSDGELGARLVAWYSQRLIVRVQDGESRAQAAGVLDQAYRFERAGETRFIATKAPWRASRLVLALLLLFGSMLIIVSVIIVIDLLDRSFRSTRQVARYLETPVLGELPDLDVLSRRLKVEP